MGAPGRSRRLGAAPVPFSACCTCRDPADAGAHSWRFQLEFQLEFQGRGWCQGACSPFPAAEPEGMDSRRSILSPGIPAAPGVLSLIPGGCWLPIPVFGMLGSPCPHCFDISLFPHPSDPAFPSPPTRGNDVTKGGIRHGALESRYPKKQTPSRGPAPDLSALTHSWHPKLPSPPIPWIIPGASRPAGFIPAPDVLG